MERGYAGVGIDEIGAAVGISGPAVYRHVAGKEQLLTEIALNWLDEITTRIQSVRDTHLSGVKIDPEEQHRRVLQTGVDYCLATIPHLTVVLRYVHPGIEHEAFAPRALTESLPEETVQTGLDEARSFAVERFARMRDTLAHSLRHFNPSMPQQSMSVYTRAAAALVLGAASSDRDISHSARSNALVMAAMRLLRTPLIEGEMSIIKNDVPGWSRASRREQILRTAVRMFRERGYGGVSMADIAGEVGITASASYRHFVSKDDLLATAMLRTANRFVSGLGESLLSAHSADQAMTNMLHRYVMDTLADRDMALVTGRERFHLAEEPRAELHRLERVVFDEWSLALAALRPEYSPAERDLLIAAAHRVIVEMAYAWGNASADSLENMLFRMAQSILGVGQPVSAGEAA
ncbi:DNA-binding transcriptional repressor AcrR [Dermatophilus congolensis]|uniref:DNA-binding transcriptional repressor AcrR n=2 Tax=Dermatophilus congolensis TaxID=1863 RepID=A0AA46H123_9MICO|nr:DNA-binding transcriptional repressor AcrR [Dermatophilus congolensis]